MPRITNFIAFLFLVCLFSPPVLSQITAEVTVHADDPTYKTLRNSSTGTDAFSGEFATVNNLVIKRDAGVFTLKTGEIYFLKPTDGRITGAVFLGTGEFSLTPPVDVEKKAVAIFTNAPEVKEGFGALTMFFSDQTFEEVKASSAVQMGKSGTQSEKARSTFRAKEDLLKKTFGYNINSRTLADLYGPKERKGYFTAFIDGDKFGKLLYQLDPMGITEVYPEEVALISYDQGTGGIWSRSIWQMSTRNAPR